MFIQPIGNSLDGLIHRSILTGTPFSSSNNKNEGRKNNPILHDVDDRWCSGFTTQYANEYWGMYFNASAYITHYTLQNAHNIFLTSFFVEGQLNNDRWINISDITDFGIGEFEYKTVKTTYAGPFKSINFTSRINQRDDNGYHFCIHKVEFFGSLFYGTTINIRKPKINLCIFLLIILLSI